MEIHLNYITIPGRRQAATLLRKNVPKGLSRSKAFGAVQVSAEARPECRPKGISDYRALFPKKRGFFAPGVNPEPARPGKAERAGVEGIAHACLRKNVPKVLP